MSDALSVEVQHDKVQQRFVITLDKGFAVLEYRLFNPDKPLAEPVAVNFTRTWVPPEFRGKGLAEKLVREGLAWARAENLKIQASCWYVAKFLRPGDQS